MVTAATQQSDPRPAAFDGEVDLDRDRRLVQSAQGGNKEAFDVLYEFYFTRLERYCLRRLHDPHEAQDIAQEAFLRAWRALPSFGGDRRFYPWLSVIASNLCTDSLRRKRRFGPVPVAEFRGQEASTGNSAEESAMALEELDLAARAFRQLSDRHRRVLYLREQSGLSYQAIADQEGLRVTTVETLIWRARKALRREFAALSGSEGMLGGAAVAGAFWSRSLKHLLRRAGSLSTRVASTGPKGLGAAFGGAVGTAAIVVASYAGATHTLIARPSALPEKAKSVSVVPAASVPPRASIPGSRTHQGPSVSAPPTSSAVSTSGGSAKTVPPTSAASPDSWVAPPRATSNTRPGGSAPGGSDTRSRGRAPHEGGTVGSALGTVSSALGNATQQVIDVGSLIGGVDRTLGSTTRDVTQITRSVDGEASKTIASILGSLGAPDAGARPTGRGAPPKGPGPLGGLLG